VKTVYKPNPNPKLQPLHIITLIINQYGFIFCHTSIEDVVEMFN